MMWLKYFRVDVKGVVYHVSPGEDKPLLHKKVNVFLIFVIFCKIPVGKSNSPK